MSIIQPPDPTRLRVTGIAFNLVPGRDPSTGSPWGGESELQRTTDSAGAPNVGAAATIADNLPPLPASGGVVIDQRPMTTDRWWYRWRHKGAGVNPGNWSAWFSATPAIVPKDVLARAINAQTGVYPLRPDFRMMGAARSLLSITTPFVPNAELDLWEYY